MRAEYKHTDINQTIRGMRQQIIDSVQYCANNIPRLNTPRQLWQFLKPRVTFKHDPDKIELLQSAQTLFERNEHGAPGLGDCDCFCILATASAICQNFPVDIVLAGQTKRGPTHIYNIVYSHDGEPFIFDLTQPTFNNERRYKHVQKLSIPYVTNKILSY